MNQPEKLNLWDRLFNRYRKEIVDRGNESWSSVKTLEGMPIESTRRSYNRNYVDYRVIDRVTGSETIEREYLN